MCVLKRVVAVLSLSVCVILSPRLVRAEGLSLTQVIANVQSNEQLYRDIEVIRTDEYRHFASGETSRDINIRKQTRQRRSVIQGSMFYLKVTGGQDLVNQKSYDLFRLYGYDGKATRHVAGGGPTTDRAGKHRPVANVTDERLNPCDIFVPHTCLIQGASTCLTPLSVVLRGGKEFANYPDNGGHKNKVWKTFLEGEEEVDGLRCVKLRLESHDIRESKLFFNTRRFLWLAIDRNYLPVKTTAYVMFENPNVALEESIAKDFREIGSGIWLPYERETIAYDYVLLRKDPKTRKVRNRLTQKIDLAKLDPKYDVSLFRDIAIPDGAAVYELNKGHIVDSYMQPGDPTLPGTRYHWWLLAALAIVVLALAGVLVWRRGFHARRSMPSE
jgi:hypothetical protein